MHLFYSTVLLLFWRQVRTFVLLSDNSCTEKAFQYIIQYIFFKAITVLGVSETFSHLNYVQFFPNLLVILAEIQLEVKVQSVLPMHWNHYRNQGLNQYLKRKSYPLIGTKMQWPLIQLSNKVFLILYLYEVFEIKLFKQFCCELF